MTRSAAGSDDPARADGRFIFLEKPYPELEVVLDVHFGNSTQRERLNEVLMERLSLVKKPIQLDSQTDAVIQVADFVAGAVLSQHTNRGRFVDLFADKVVVGKVVKWRHLAKKKR